MYSSGLQLQEKWNTNDSLVLPFTLDAGLEKVHAGPDPLPEAEVSMGQLVLQYHQTR